MSKRDEAGSEWMCLSGDVHTLDKDVGVKKRHAQQLESMASVQGIGVHVFKCQCLPSSPRLQLRVSGDRQREARQQRTQGYLSACHLRPLLPSE